MYDTNLFHRRLAAHLRAHRAHDQIHAEFDVPDVLRDRFGPRRKQPFTVADFLSIPSTALARAVGKPVTAVQRERLLTILRGLKAGGKQPYGDQA